MGQILISGLDESVVEVLQQKADLHGRSFEEELRDILTNAARLPAGQKRLTPAEKVAIADRIRAMTPPGPQSDSTQLIREDRDR